MDTNLTYFQTILSRFLSLQRIFGTDEITKVCLLCFFAALKVVSAVSPVFKTHAPFQPFVSFLRKLMSVGMGQFPLRSMSACVKPMESRCHVQIYKNTSLIGNMY